MINIKVVILAGGFGTRISEESHLKPKPMIEIGDMPILWHIMKFYSSYGFCDFIICCGYKSYVIKEFFFNYYLHTSNVTFDFRNSGQLEIHQNVSEPWRVTLVDTGLKTSTAGRLLRVSEHIANQPFLFTYGDGLSDISLPNLIDFHKKVSPMATVTAVEPEGRFGALEIKEDGIVNCFIEKPPGDNGWINGGYMVMQPEILKRITGDDCVLESEVLPALAEDGLLSAYRHKGFWRPMDTVRDRSRLETLWKNEEAPWKRW